MTNPCADGRPLNFGHLGGTSTRGDPDSYFPEMWEWLIGYFKLESVLDVGCGVGYAQKFFHDHGLTTFGVEGSQDVLRYHPLPQLAQRHDLTTGVWAGPGRLYDLVWCCEVAEHVEERFVQNVIETLRSHCGKVLAFCAAPVGAGGYHHVNCQNPPYWIEKLTAAGLCFREDLTGEAKKLAPPGKCGRRKSYFDRSGLIFTA